MTTSPFAELGLAEPIVRALNEQRYDTPTPIQAHAIPSLLAGRDLLGIAQTGTGKTAAFALPMLQRLAEGGERARPKRARALVLAPTRELAIQIADSFATYGRHLGLRHAVVVGGVGHGPQIKAASRGVDILVATPGRLLDLIAERHVVLDAVSWLVLDEADRMLDMGFIRDVRKIIAGVPKQRQTLLFSATMPGDVERLARDILNNPQRVDIAPAAPTVERIDQRVMAVAAGDKRAVLTGLLGDAALARVLVFTRTKHGANKLAEHLGRAGITVDAIHGNKAQSARQRALERFRAGKARVLVATDIAARGIDVDDITHVINFELPSEPESYVHRIGRTARAGASGIALSLCDAAETDMLRRIEKLAGRRLTVVGDVALLPAARPAKGAAPPPRRPKRRRRAAA